MVTITVGSSFLQIINNHFKKQKNLYTISILIMKEAKGRKNNKNTFAVISYINLGITIACLIIFLITSICLNDYTYLYGSLMTLPSSWLQILFYYLLFKNMVFPKSRSGFNRTKTTVNYAVLFFMKTFVVYLPFIILIALYASGIYVFNIYAVLVCGLIFPLVFFFLRYFVIKQEPDQGGD